MINVKPTTAKTLTFDRNEVRELLDHTLKAEHRTPHRGLYEGDATPPGLWFVGDSGIYLMSNGHRANGKHGSPGAFAIEANPRTVDFDECYDLKHEIFKGDEYLFISAEEIRLWLEATFGLLTLKIDGNQYELVQDLYPSEL